MERLNGPLALIASLAGGVIAFTGYGSLPRDGRLAIVGLAGIAAWVFGLGYALSKIKGTPRRHRFLVAGTVSVAIIAMTIGASWLAVTYHSVITTVTGSGGDGVLEISPPRTGVRVTLYLSVPGETRFCGFEPGSIGADDVLWGIEKDEPAAKTLVIHGFRYPAKFRVAYCTTGAYTDLDISHAIDPEYVERIDRDWVSNMVKWLVAIGGVACVVVLGLLSRRW